ncbi:MAG: type II secretion system F family protein [Phycisphaeraceae bacterium]|nr:type II secretion system F family protein [Phycisphaeraceae bacterium]
MKPMFFIREILWCTWWAIIGLFVLVALCFPLFWMGVFAPVGALFVMHAWSRISLIQRRRRALTMLSYLDMATRIHLPLSKLVSAASRSERGVMRGRIEHFAEEHLRRGVPLDVALRRAVPEISPEIAAELAVTERSGQLASTLSRIINRELRDIDHQGGDRNTTRAYLVTVFIVTATMSLSFLFFTMPNFKVIFDDFEMTPPITFQWFCEYCFERRYVAQLVYGFMWVLVLSAIGRMTFNLMCGGTYPLVHRGDPFDAILSSMPVLGRWRMERDLARVLAMGAEQADAGQPFHRVLLDMETLPVTGKLHRRLTQWRLRLENGAEIGDTLGLRLPKLVTGLLASSCVTGTLPAAMACLAREYDRRTVHRQQLMDTLMPAFGVLLMSVPVGLFVVTLFQPLAALIWQTIRVSGSY